MENEKTKKDKSSPLQAFISPSVLEHLECVIKKEQTAEVQLEKKALENSISQAEKLQFDALETEEVAQKMTDNTTLIEKNKKDLDSNILAEDENQRTHFIKRIKAYFSNI